MTVEKALAAATEAIAELNNELTAHANGEGSLGPVALLESFRRQLEAMRRNLESATLPPRTERHSGMGRVIADSRPFDSRLGSLILRAEQQHKRA